MPTQKVSLDELLSLTKEALARGEKIILASDIDLTLSNDGPNGQDDPRKTELHPRSVKALRAISEHGQYIGIISNRSGWQIAGMLMESGIKNAEIVGTYGIEQFVLKPESPDRGTKIIDERFQLYAEPITTILREIRLDLLKSLGQQDLAKEQIVLEIPTPGGQIILERKGLCDSFPEGHAAVYNFNLVDPAIRTDLASHMEKHFSTLTAEAMIHHPVQTLALLNVWRIQPYGRSSQPGRYSVSFQPHIKQVKGYGMEHLLRGIREKIDDAAKIGLIVFAGDDDADAEAMRAAADAVAVYNKDLISHRPIRSMGIWVKPQADQPIVRKQADMIVEGPDGYADILEALDELCSKKAAGR